MRSRRGPSNPVFRIAASLVGVTLDHVLPTLAFGRVTEGMPERIEVTATRVPEDVMPVGVVFSILIGAIGGLLPPAGAARKAIVSALREV